MSVSETVSVAVAGVSLSRSGRESDQDHQEGKRSGSDLAKSKKGKDIEVGVSRSFHGTIYIK